MGPQGFKPVFAQDFRNRAINNFMQRTPDPVGIDLVSPQVTEISTTSSHGDSHLFRENFQHFLCLCFFFLHGAPTALCQVVWRVGPIRRAMKRRGPWVCLAPLRRSWGQDSTACANSYRTSAAYLQERVSMSARLHSHSRHWSLGRCGGPSRRVTSFSRMARRICSPACPVSSSTRACISARISAHRQCHPRHSCPPTNSNL